MDNLARKQEDSSLRPGLSVVNQRDLPDYLPARMVNEFVYCPRLFFYEWVDGVFRESVDTVEGKFQHQRVDAKATELPKPEELPAEKIHSRSVTLSSEKHRVIAKIDLVESAGGPDGGSGLGARGSGSQTAPTEGAGLQPEGALAGSADFGSSESSRDPVPITAESSNGDRHPVGTGPRSVHGEAGSADLRRSESLRPVHDKVTQSLKGANSALPLDLNRQSSIDNAQSVVTPVDYKHGHPRETEGGIELWPSDRVQLAVQGLVLRENGYRCEEGIVYYAQTRQRVRVLFDEALIAETERTIAEAWALARFGRIPPPLVDSPKCPGCSLVGICLPDETNSLRTAVSGEWRVGSGESGAVQLDLFPDGSDSEAGSANFRSSRSSRDPVPITAESSNGDRHPVGTGLRMARDEEPQSSKSEKLPLNRQSTIVNRQSGGTLPPAKPVARAIRQLVTPRDDLRPLYLNLQGLRVGKSGEVLQVREKDELKQEVRIGEICQVNLMGNIQVSTQAVQALCDADKPVCYFSQGGWFYGITTGLNSKNIFLRKTQFRLAEEDWFALALARRLVAGKVRNQRTMLQRNHLEPNPQSLLALKQMAEQAERAANLEQLLGIEGNAARVYFGDFAGMMKLEETEAVDRAPLAQFHFDFSGRNRRPPRDAVNAMLSLAYSLLVKDFTITCYAVGFDPYMGFYHQPRFGRPALALDLMEPFRPLVADSAVLTAINTRMVTPQDFVRAGPGVALTPGGRRGFFRAYELRMDTLVTHPMFEYRVSYRRLLEIQARLLARVLEGEIGEYPVFVTR